MVARLSDRLALHKTPTYLLRKRGFLMTDKQIAVYARVSTAQQSTRSQMVDLERWAKAQEPDYPIEWYEDKVTGKTFDRPGWQKLQTAIDAGQIDKLVVWRLDRLGRTASGLCALFEDLQAKKVRLVSLKDSIDLGTSSGRLMANVLASVAAYETEIRGERVRAGQAVAKAAGKRWGGRQVGQTVIASEKIEAAIGMLNSGKTRTYVAAATGISRRHLYNLLPVASK